MKHEDGWSEALRDVHLSLSETDLKFRELARKDPALLRRSTFGVLDGDARLKERKQAWPTFVGGAKLAQLKDLSRALAALVRAVPRRIFHDDPGRICEFYGLPSHAAVEILLAPPTGIEGSMARGDLIDTEDGFKCIEFNFGVNLGGWETSLLADLYQRIPEIVRFLEAEGIRPRSTSTLRALFREVLRQAERGGIGEGGELNVACAIVPAVSDPAVLRSIEALLQQELEGSLRDAGLALRGRVVTCRYMELVVERGRLLCRNVPVQVVLEMAPGHAPAPAYWLFKAGGLVLLNGAVNEMLSEKRNIALLSEAEGSSVWSPEEREVIRRHIPWTRLVRPATTKLGAEEVFLPDLLASERDRLVLKKGRSLGGEDVLLGRFTSASRWEELVRSALETGGWVVQEHWESLPYLYQCGEQGCAPHSMIWGPFVFGDSYGGVILRLQPRVAGGPINLTQTASEGIIFEV